MRTLLILLLLAFLAVAQVAADQPAPAPEQASPTTDWATWAKNWNEVQYAVARERAEADTILKGYVVRTVTRTEAKGGGRRIYGSRPFPYFPRGSSYTENVITTTKRTPQQWTIRGYGGGPVTIYNPHVPQPVPE